ncbi:MAG: hypothetical protein II453_14115 [Alphaproteobacteria bacterium]|nr:hypothetical protein [Alphaproteobacteria bacterium]
MKTKILALVLGALLTIPCVLRAEKVEINVGDKVVIKKDFEVKQGGQLLIH